MFCEDIRNILRTQNLDEGEIFGTEAVLDPQIGGGEMADLSKSASPTDAHRRCGVRLNHNVPFQSKVSRDRSEAHGI